MAEVQRHVPVFALLGRRDHFHRIADCRSSDPSRVAAAGSLLLTFMSLTTLSFLATTPEAWVPPLGDTAHGFPFLAGAGRLLIKDAIMFGAAIVTMADSAKAYQQGQEQQ